MWLVKTRLDVYARATSVARGHHRTPNGIVNNQWRCAHEVIRGLQVSSHRRFWLSKLRLSRNVAAGVETQERHRQLWAHDHPREPQGMAASPRMNASFDVILDPLVTTDIVWHGRLSGLQDWYDDSKTVSL